jgi:hypothetical protein
MADKFPLPTNVWTEEEVPVKKTKFDPKTGKTFSSYELEKVKTMYIDAPKEKLRCKNGDHIFECINGSKGLFKCTNCPYHRQVYPSSYMFLNGRLVNKRTGLIV